MAIPEDTATDLSNYRISRTFQGLLHMPHSVVPSSTAFAVQQVYDGLGNRTALIIGGSGLRTDIRGDVTISKSLSVEGDCFVNGNFQINGNMSLVGGGSINDIIIYEKSSDVSLRALSTVQAGKLRIRDSQNTLDHYELIYGNPNDSIIDKNLFTLKVNNDSDNNFYIKNVYADPDESCPLWIERSTGIVHIRSLRVVRITTGEDPTKPDPPIVLPRTPNAHRHEIIIGQIAMFAALGLPEGWLECDGSTYEISTFPELFSKIGYLYTDSSIPTSQFSVPDLRGLFVRHLDKKRKDEKTSKNIDQEPNRLIGSYQVDTYKSHFHYLDGISNENEPTYNQWQDMLVPAAICVYNPYLGLIGSPFMTFPFPGATILFVPKPIPFQFGTSTGETFKDITEGRNPGRTEHTPPLGDPTGLETRPQNIALIYAIKW